MTKRELVDQWLAAAYAAKQEVAARFPDVAPAGIPASITVCQAILETGYGRFIPVDVNTGRFSYNLFGIKGDGAAGHVTCWTQEFEDGAYKRVLADFRAYHGYEESFLDHALLFVQARWSPGKYIYRHCLPMARDPRTFARCVGPIYATGPLYADKLITIGQQWGFFS